MDETNVNDHHEPSTANETISITRATTEDIQETTQVHLKSFQGYFLSNFGDAFLDIYYRNYLSNPKHLLMVAKVNCRVVGFVAGTSDARLLHQTLFKSHFSPIIILTFKRFLSNRDFRRQVFKRIHFVKMATKSIFSIGKTDVQQKKTKEENQHARLLSIAVLGEFRGEGVSLPLIKSFEKELRKNGVLVCGLTVKETNLRGISFYKKAGWKSIKNSSGSVAFTKNLTVS